jgi:SAM-dependent methyltransferase
MSAVAQPAVAQPALAEAAVRRALAAHEQRGDTGAARALILQAISAGLITAGLLSDLATIQVECGDLPAAERTLCAALTLDGESLAARRNLAELLLLTHRHALAVRVIRSILPHLTAEERERLAPHVELHDAKIAPWNAGATAADEISERLQHLPGVELVEENISIQDFERFPCAHPWSPAPHYYEKKLQYYLSATALRLNGSDTFVDIASQGSAFPGYAKRIIGCDVFRQDLTYQAGRPHYLPGDACALPVPDGFFTAMTLHCSFEHFERDADTRFIREAARVLRPGGRLCIVPLYMELEPVERYARSFAVGSGQKAFGPGCEFYRGYSVESLYERVLQPAAADFAITIVRTANLPEVQASLPPYEALWSHFLLLLRRR